MTDEQFVALVTIATTAVAGVIALAAALSAIYIVWVYRQRHEESLFLTRLVHRNVRVSIASAVILGYLVLALSGFSFGRPWGAVVITVPILLMMIGPISDALLWRRERRMAPERAQARTNAAVKIELSDLGKRMDAHEERLP